MIDGPTCNPHLGVAIDTSCRSTEIALLVAVDATTTAIHIAGIDDVAVDTGCRIHVIVIRCSSDNSGGRSYLATADVHLGIPADVAVGTAAKHRAEDLGPTLDIDLRVMHISHEHVFGLYAAGRLAWTGGHTTGTAIYLAVVEAGVGAAIIVFTDI